MNFEHFKKALIGEWQGTKQLFMEPPPTPAVSSSSKLSIAPVAAGCFLQLSYNWTYENEEQTGLLLLSFSNDNGTATAAWVDSFHMSAKVMFCTGDATDDAVNVHGSYEAPPGPDWRWRIAIQSVSERELKIVMHNISPEGAEDLAVQMDYTRGQFGVSS